jgi:thioredoxin
MKHLETLEEFNEAIEDSRLVVIDFYAQWCGPCKRLAPKYEELAEEYGEKIVCYKVDVDVASDIARECAISAMPTFHFYKNGDKISDFMGANEAKLRDTIKENA